MFNQYSIYDFPAEIQGSGIRSEVAVNIVSLIRKLAVAKRPRHISLSVSLKILLSLKVTRSWPSDGVNRNCKNSCLITD